MGYLSVVVLEMNIVAMHQRRKLFCAEWYVCLSGKPLQGGC